MEVHWASATKNRCVLLRRLSNVLFACTFVLCACTRPADLLPVQIPSFEVRQVSSSLNLTITRAKGNPRNSTKSAEILVIANNATAEGGIQDGWLTNGLARVDMLVVRCGKPAVCNLRDNCTTIWIDSNNCSTFNESHLSVEVVSLADGLAQLSVEAHALSLLDGTYHFTIYLPIPNNISMSTVATISGALTIDGICKDTACAQQHSTLTLTCTRAHAHMRTRSCTRPHLRSRSQLRSHSRSC